MSHPALTPGLYQSISHDAYHADPCERPSLSASLAKTLINRSPRHAWQEHPRLGGKRFEESNEQLDRGTLIHAMLLGGGPEIVPLDFADFRTKEAQRQRDEAKQAGKLPVLAYRLADCKIVVDRLEKLVDPARYITEATAVWKSGAALCRGRLDMYDPSAGHIQDLKTCEDARSSSSPRNMLAMGYHISASAYLEAIETLYPDLRGRTEFTFIFAEVHAPFEVLRVRFSGEFLALGRRQWGRAVDLWTHCLNTNQWPGYTDRIERVEPPAWAMDVDLEEASKQGVWKHDAA